MKTTMTMLAVTLAMGTTALADTPKPDAAKKAPEPKMDIKKAEPKAPAMTPPKAPQEVADMAKAMAGYWKCTGKGVMDPSKPTEMTDMKGTYKAALDLDKFFVKGEWTGTAGKINMRGIMFTTYDAAAKKWHRVTVSNDGGVGIESSSGVKDGKAMWEGEMRMMGMTVKGRTTEEIKDKEIKMTGEMSMDGKKWMTGWEMTCKK